MGSNQYPDETTNTLEEIIEEITEGELYDPECGFLCEITLTQETFDNWVESSKMWSDKSRRIEGNFTTAHGAIPFMAWPMMQAIKGQTRRGLSVIDIGSTRCAIDVDLSAFC